LRTNLLAGARSCNLAVNVYALPGTHQSQAQLGAALIRKPLRGLRIQILAVIAAA
jgi:hypothetical protein